ncbi:Uncharacterised protein [Segatella copri]|nr:Uncharacterised protein [Segatella copri]
MIEITNQIMLKTIISQKKFVQSRRKSIGGSSHFIFLLDSIFLTQRIKKDNLSCINDTISLYQIRNYSHYTCTFRLPHAFPI